MKRRAAIALLPAAALLAQPYLDTEAFATLEQLCDLLIPSEPGSPGAREARVAWYIHVVLQHAPPDMQARWRQELARIGPGVTDAVMAREAADESGFLNTLFKPLAIEAFCLSREGRAAFGYKGNRAIDAFPGCTHPEHA